MLNLLTILTLEHRYIGLIVSACVIVLSIIAIVIRYFKRTKVDETNVDIVYPVKQVKAEDEAIVKNTSETETSTPEVQETKNEEEKTSVENK